MARKLSVRHLQIDKANQMVIIITSIAVAVFVFGVFAGRALLLRRNHQARVISAKETAVRQLRDNLAVRDQVVDAYKTFTSGPVNIIGGSTAPGATGSRDGDNARIVLDALPSKYDFPALVTSIAKFLSDNGLKLETIEGNDDEVAQTALGGQAEPVPLEIPLNFNVIETNYAGAQTIVNFLERSIRPFSIRRLELTRGNQGEQLQVSLDIVTYYQPEKTLSITKKEVR